MRDAGHAGVEFALGAAVLLLPAALVVLSFGPWLERNVTAEAVAAESAREAALRLDLSAGETVAFDVADAAGVDADELRIGWCGATPTAAGSGSCGLGRGSAVEVEVEVWTPLFTTPWGPVGGVWVSGHHAEPIDLYRSIG